MDNNSIAILQDHQEITKKSFVQIEKEIKKYSNSKFDLRKTIENAKTYLVKMKEEIEYLKNENTKQKWQDTIEKLELKIKGNYKL